MAYDGDVVGDVTDRTTHVIVRTGTKVRLWLTTLKWKDTLLNNNFTMCDKL